MRSRCVYAVGVATQVRLNTAAVTPSPPYSREICTCRPGYSGSHCTDCAWGYARVANVCLPCACSGHATCETVDGECGPCQHNTTGPHCERCLPGHYGNPLKGGCKPCACPLYEASNNFSPLCALASPDDDDDFVCTQCPDGYTGDRCEMCDAGYWGSPLTPGSSCQPCACSGAACHPASGACVQCGPHARGAACDQCQMSPGVQCGPHARGAACDQCQMSPGVQCGPHARGAACDQCQEGYYNDTSSPACVPCACGPGSLHALCDERGACACAQGWAGRACDECAEGYGGDYYNDSSPACVPCACGPGSLHALCDERGACACA
ncbi:unnamed protein product [Plutella xylostella]|uniref:(diamondback moth) hypothetical protein n=1 Tax=Plutella xylostella TaxID=51655 RepID=A0A8S4F0F2_PLUXY|nr:unnamed protein product [Plutella xylostella]